MRDFLLLAPSDMKVGQSFKACSSSLGLIRLVFDTSFSVTPLTHEPSEVLGKLLLECPCDYLVLTESPCIESGSNPGPSLCVDHVCFISFN